MFLNDLFDPSACSRTPGQLQRRRHLSVWLWPQRWRRLPQEIQGTPQQCHRCARQYILLLLWTLPSHLVDEWMDRWIEKSPTECHNPPHLTPDPPEGAVGISSIAPRNHCVIKPTKSNPEHRVPSRETMGAICAVFDMTLLGIEPTTC